MKIKFLSVFFFSYFTIFSQDYLDNEIYIKYRQNPSNSDISLVRTSLESYPLRTMEKTFRSPELQSIYTITFQSKVDLEAIIERLQALAMIEYAEKVPLHRLFYTPNDPQYTSQWNLSKILASQAWNIHQGSAAIKIAITDNGFLLTHQDLVNKWAINTADNNNNGADDDGNGYVDDWRGWDAADNDNDPSVPASATATIWSHGNHVAGISAGETNNSLGIASIGFNCKLIPVKIGQSSTGWLTGAYQGVDYAIAAGADVINMSWGGSSWSATGKAIFDLAYSKGILCVAAAGNNNDSAKMYPASFDHVISVAATGAAGSTTSDARAWFSSYGSLVDVSAPGVDITSALHTGTSNYGLMNGTSMASPLVAGLVGLMKSYNPAPIDTIEACLKRTCDNINNVNSAYIGKLGAGRVNALQALQCLAKKPVSLIEVLDTFQCVGQVVRYQAKSFGAPTLSYAWTFPGGSPLTSTQPNPSVSYGGNGWKSATLITSNSYGSDTMTINNLVRIDSPRAYLNGNRYTIFSSIPVMIPIRFSGNSPYTVTLTDGMNTWTQSGITSNPYYFQISPQKDTSYIAISAYSDKSCVGAWYGVDTIYKKKINRDTTICITLKTSSPNCIDGFASTLNSSLNLNWTFTHNENVVANWTSSGSPATWKNIYKFDLSSIPANAVINSALFSIQAKPNATHGWSGQPTAGTNNSAYIRRVTSSWTPSTISTTAWPSTTTTNEVTLPQTPNNNYSHTNIDVKNLVNDMRSNPNYGFLIGHYGTNYYNSIISYSGDDTDTSKHPKLEICYTIPGGGSSLNNVCRDSMEINSGQSGWQALNTSGTWGSLSSCNYVTSIFTANASNFPGMTSGDCLWGPIVQNPSRTYYNSSSNTTTSSANANIAVFRKQLNISQGAIIDSVRIWMLSDDFVDSVFLNNKMIYTAPIPIVYGQVLFTKKDSLIGIANSQNYLTIKAGNFGGYYGHYFRAKVYYSYLCDTPSNCDTSNLNNGLVLNLPFNGNTNDISGNGLNATNNGATLTTGRNGLANTAYRLNGISSSIVRNNIPMNLNSNWTMSFWCRLNTYKYSMVLMEFLNSSNTCNGNFHLYQYNNNVYNAQCGTSYNTNWGLIGDTTSLQNSFHHIGITKSGNNIKIYKDCNLISDVNVSYNSATNSNLIIGAALNVMSTPSQFSNMDIDDYRLYNRVLNLNELKALGDCCIPEDTIPVLKNNVCINDSILFITDTTYWKIISNTIGDPSNVKAKQVSSQYNADPNISQAKWISTRTNWLVYGTAGPPDSAIFQYKFKTLASDSIRFKFNFYRDNYANIYVDNRLINKDPVGAISAHYSGSSIDSTVYLTSGIHIIKVVLYNHNSYTGNNGFGFMTAGYISNKNKINCDPCSDTLGLVLCMSMDSTMRDSSIYGNHGINNSVSFQTDRNGLSNGSGKFTNNAYVTVPRSSSIKTIFEKGKISILSWVKADNWYNNWNGIPIFEQHINSTDGGLSFEGNWSAGGHLFIWDRSATSYAGFSYSWNFNQWKCLALTYDADTAKYYVDGVLVSKKHYTSNFLISDTSSLITRIGASLVGPDEYMEGNIDNLKVYNRALTSQEILDYYNKPFLCSCSPTNPIVIDSPKCTKAQKYGYTKCSIDSIQLSARQGSQYVWSPNIELSSNVIQNPICYVTNSRIYYVLYTDTAGCQIVDTFDIKVRTPKFYSPLSDETICNGDSVQISIPIYATNIQWSPTVDISNTSVRNPYFFPSVSRTYYLKFIDSMGCPHWDTIQINVKACCDARARFVLSDSIVCFGIHPRIYNTSKGNINFYNWTFGTAIPNATNAANPPIMTFPTTGSYPIRLVVGNASCRDTMDRNIYIIGVQAYAGRDTYNCVNPLVVKLGGSTMGMQNYSWTPTTGLDDPNISNPTATLTNTSISYIVEVTDMFSNCTSYDTVVVSNLNAVNSLNETRKICQGDSTYFNGKYYKNTGIYRDTVRRKSLNCDSIISSFTLTHLVPDSLKYAMQYYCNRYVDAKGKVWTDDLTLRDTIDSKQGCDSLYRIFPIKVTKPTFADKLMEACNEKLYRSRRYTSSKDKVDSTILKSKVSNCDSIITYTNIVIHSNPDAKIISDKKNPVKFEDKVTLEASGGVKYEWQPGGMTTEKIIYNVLDTASKTFIVKVIDTNKCWDTASYTIYVLLPDSCFVGIPNAFSPNNDNRNDIFIPNLSACAKIITFKIFNRWGEKVFETDRNEGWDGWYKGEMQGIGVYMYYIEIQTIFGKREFKNTFSLVR